MTTRIRFLGVAGFEVEGPTFRFVIDPFLHGNHLAPVTAESIQAPDLILVSHAAYDHLGDTAEIAIRTGAPVVCGGDVRLLLLERGVPERQVRATIWGVIVDVNGIVVRPVECHHWSQSLNKDGKLLTGTPLAFMVETEPGVKFYHYGDTAIFDMSLFGRLYQPTIAFLGCTDPFELADETQVGRVLTGEMSPNEAAMAAEMLGVDVAIACHYMTPTPDVDEFIRQVAAHDTSMHRQALGPGVGDWFIVEKAPHGVRLVKELSTAAS
jgi:L-ascorbate metabolism protein UlaG (beta-lactamase superfamily)